MHSEQINVAPSYFHMEGSSSGDPSFFPSNPCLSLEVLGDVRSLLDPPELEIHGTARSLRGVG